MKGIVTHTFGALIVACVLALPAVAGQHPNDQAGMQGVGAVAASTHTKTTVAKATRPDGRQMPDGVDLAPAPPTIVATSDGFDWGDATIGLAGGLGLALVLAGVLATTLRGRHVPGAS